MSIYHPIGFDKVGNETSLMDVLFTDNDILETVDIKMLEERIVQMMSALSRR